MVHLVYFSAGNLGDRVVYTEPGPAVLINCLRTLLQNCLLLDFKDYRFGDEIRSEADKLPDHVRKQVKALLAQLKKRKRIIPAADDDYSGKADVDLLTEQTEKLGLELVIIQGDERWDEATTRVPRASIATYAMSDFEARRSDEMADRHLRDNDMSGDEFIERYLVPFLRFSERLDIIDGSLGENYRSKDYGRTIDRLFAAVRRICACGNALEINLHCRRGRGYKSEFVRDEVYSLARNHGLGDRVRIWFYGDPERRRGAEFLHDRCLVSQIGVVNIGRGFDFINEQGRLKNTMVGFGGPDIGTLLAPFAGSEST